MDDGESWVGGPFKMFWDFFFWGGGGYFCRGDLIIWSYILRGIAMNNGVLYIDLYEIRGSFFDIGSLDFDLDFDL